MKYRRNEILLKKNKTERFFTILGIRIQQLELSTLLQTFKREFSWNIIKLYFTGINDMELIIGSFYYINSIKTLVAMKTKKLFLKHYLTCIKSILRHEKVIFALKIFWEILEI